MEFIKYNANPKKWKHEGDCVIRALASATQKKWEEVYKELSDIGLKKCRTSISNEVIDAFLKQYNFATMKQEKDSYGRWIDVESLVERFPNSILVIHCRGHLTVAIRDKLIDTWNCSSQKAGKFYIKSIENENKQQVGDYIQYVIDNREPERRKLF